MKLFARHIAFSLLLLLTGATALYARDPKLATKLYQDSAIFTMKIEKGAVPTAGKSFDVRIHIAVRKPYHIWSSTMSDEGGLIPTSIKVPEELASYFVLTNLKEFSRPEIAYDSNFQQVTKAIHQPFDLVATIKVKRNSTEPVPFYLYITYQTCNESQCLPPATFKVPMDVLDQKPLMLKIAHGVPDTTNTPLATQDTFKNSALHKDSTVGLGQSAGGAPSQPPSGGTPAAPVVSANVSTIADASIWQFILAAAGFGLLALLTPCVFPMVPITVSFFTKRNAGSKKEAAKDAFLYAGGIVVTFVLLGFMLSLIAGPAGINEFAANPWANLVIAAIFIAFALNLFGLFEIGVPSSVLSKLNATAQHSKNRMFSVVLMGFVFSLTSFTCTVPFVGTLMVAFSRGTWFVPLIGMVVFATIFASPFFFLALFPNLMKSLPRSGTWMNNVKVVMGFLEVAAALKFFSNVDLIWSWHFFSRDLVLAAWIAIAIITTVYLLGRFQLSHDTPIDHIGGIRVLMAVTFLAVGIYLYTGLNGHPLGQLDGFLPPVDSGELAQTASLVNSPPSGTPVTQIVEQWIPSYSTALAEAKKTGKNVFIDFTGYTCTNCRSMEATIFKRQDVKQIFQKFVLARLYTDNGTPLNDSNRDMEENRFNTIALPFYVIVSPNDKPLATFPGFTRDVQSFKDFLTLQKQSGGPSVAMLGQ
ncbi:MAG TPA: cytochrome c biogenesis protein CcdA [Candidatus Kapabacteria bacterium]|nr:cytochrome c biogenesis protein CcdA [Candidatus Kapabacteria bacterium]